LAHGWTASTIDLRGGMDILGKQKHEKHGRQEEREKERHVFLDDKKQFVQI